MLELEIGKSYLRLDLHNAFGGNPRAGICPTASGVVLVFSDPPSGKKFGYDQNDGVVGNIYRYTGEGQTGDQQLVRGNKALLSERRLLLFSRLDAKSWIHIGEVKLDEEPFELRSAKDSTGKLRQVLVFRLIEQSANFKLLNRN